VLDLPTLSDDLLQQSRDKLKELDDKEGEKLKRDKVKNTLESFIVETKVKLEEEEYSQSTTDDEKTNIQTQLSGASDWLEYESDGAEVKLFSDKLSELKALTKALFERVKEHRERPEMLGALNNMLNISAMFYGGAVNASADDQVFTEVELQTLKKLIDDTKAWVETSAAEQNKMAKSESPKLTLKSIAEKMGALDREVKYMLNKARITPPKKKVVDTESTDKKEV
jgi:hypoxia up-regulated 1